MKSEKKNSLSFPKGFHKYGELTELAFSPEATVLVALSGGADSVALFDLTAKLCKAEGRKFYACHVNHGIRGQEALRDRDFCVSLAKSCPYCKEIFVLDADVPKIAEASGESLELAARRVRYEFFEKVMSENSISLLATAHNADDNLETLIFNLIRGSGAKGMRGIPPTRILPSGRLVVRPMLKMSKAEILEYCRENHLEYMTDSTNANVDYSRNLIRNEVVPLLERINPALREHASALADDMRDLYSPAEKEADAVRGDTSVEALSSLSSAAFPEAIGKIMKKSGFSVDLERVHVKAIKDLIGKNEEGSLVSLPGSTRARISGGRLIFEADVRKTASTEKYEISLKMGENLLPDGSRLLITNEIPTDLTYKFVSKINFDPETAIARNRREGDKIRIKGVNKSVKKLMCDQKLDREMRDRIPLIISNGNIIAITGVAVADTAYCKNKSSTTLNLIWLYQGKE